MTVQRLESLDVHRLLAKIFLYHDMQIDSKPLTEMWKDMLGEFSTKEIESAWQEWLMSEAGQRAKPKPHNLIKIIKAKRVSQTSTRYDVDKFNTTRIELPARGASWAADMLRENLQAMHRNNPALLAELACESDPVDKAMLCVQALSKPEVMNTPAMQILVKQSEIRSQNSFKQSKIDVGREKTENEYGCGR